MKGLTPRQVEILRFIATFQEHHHYAPSYREIMHHFSFSSLGTVHKHVRALQSKGALTKEKQQRRSLQPTEQHAPAPSAPTQELLLPFVGHLSVGYPLELFEKPQHLAVPPSLTSSPENTYILQVQGDELGEDKIAHGDLLVIEARQEVMPGEIMLGRVNQSDTVLKRYFPEGQSVRLEHCHDRDNSYLVRSEHLTIHGVLISLLRLYT